MKYLLYKTTNTISNKPITNPKISKMQNGTSCRAASLFNLYFECKNAVTFFLANVGNKKVREQYTSTSN